MGPLTSIRRIGIIGSGKMGADIFSFLSGYDFEIVWVCFDQEEAEIQHRSFFKRMNRQLRCGLIDEERFQKIQNAIVFCSDIVELSKCHLVIECIWESLEKKQELFKKIIPVLDGHCIIASNSSSFTPARLNPDAGTNDRFIGLHFFYPVKLKNIVEIIRTKNTSEKVLKEITGFCTLIEKRFLLQDEKNAFLLNRLFLEVQNEAYKIHTEGLLSYRQIDAIIEEHLFPDGVFKFFDQVGIDVMLQSVKNYTWQNSASYKALLDKLEELSKKNLLGVKTKAGFYDYGQEIPDGASDIDQISPDIYEKALYKLTNVYYLAAKQHVADGDCEQETLEFAAKEYMNTEKGPFTIARGNLNKK
ncbi:MAG TPA: 3-hydroxyacyl-CoA dehydrogenase family protein [Bacteroidales bacterium]|nr:3-hydroxyacyl-CoA dehydrogenase family protein [Bacteroidales bacterium]